MSNTNGYNTLTKSMNGIITVSDGMGTVIEDGNVTTDTINVTQFNSNNIQGIQPSDNITLYTNSTGNVTIGSANSLNYINGPLYVNSIFNSPTSSIAYLFPTATGDVNLGSATVPLIGEYTCTLSKHLANKGYVDSIATSNLLPLPNVWTGTSNTFNNIIYAPNIDFPSSAFFGGWLWQNIPTILSIKIGSDSMTNTTSFSCGMNNGAVAIGGGINRTANVAIANTGGFSGTVVICDANTFTGIVKIATTAGVGTNIVNIGSTSTTLTLNAGTLNIKGTNVILNPTTDVEFQKPISPTYAYNATNGSSATAGSISIGQFAPLTLNTAISLTGNSSFIRIGQFASTPAGVYMLYFYVDLNCTVANSNITFIGLFAGTGSSSFPTPNYNNLVNQSYMCGNLTLNNGLSTGYSVCAPIILTGTATNVNCFFGIFFTGGTISSPARTNQTCRLVRIA
jgi:hypothetical protein